jgi:chemotaxis protein CheY-P-specific phosphatase CheC
MPPIPDLTKDQVEIDEFIKQFIKVESVKLSDLTNYKSSLSLPELSFINANDISESIDNSYNSIVGGRKRK